MGGLQHVNEGYIGIGEALHKGRAVGAEHADKLL
jgi:hypothetical protein